MKRKIVAITGGIGSGKSSVAQILQQNGYSVIDCDKIAKQVAEQKEVLTKVQKLLGKQSIVDGKLNRPFVRNVVFKDVNLLLKYNAIFADAIKTQLQKQLSTVQENVFVEISVFDLFEFSFDQVWLVTASEQTRINRVASRDGVDEQNVVDIINKQHLPQNPTLTIINDGSLAELQVKVNDALKQL